MKEKRNLPDGVVSPQDITRIAEAILAAARGGPPPALPGDPACRPLAEAVQALRQSLADRAQEEARQREKHRLAISSIAHDLRVPLTTIMGYTEALQKGLAKTPEKEAAYLAAIALRSRDMARLIDQLSLSNKEGGAVVIHPKRLAFAPLIEAELTEKQDCLHARHVYIQTDLDPSLCLPIDPDAFRRVLTNLLHNTVKYRKKPDSLVTITLTREGGDAVFSYRDNGPGVPEAALPHLFEAGYRGDTAGAAPGSGLGLYIIAQITAAHHGAVTAANAGGLAVTITLPIAGGLSC